MGGATVWGGRGDSGHFFNEATFGKAAMKNSCHYQMKVVQWRAFTYPLKRKMRRIRNDRTAVKGGVHVLLQ